jgi:hypothetical protein
MEITADFTTLLRQASMTANEYLRNAITDIDDRLGKGYAKADPELIAAYMQTAALDMAAATIAKCIGSAIEDAGSSLDNLGDALTTALTKDGVEFDEEGVTTFAESPTSALGRVADALQNIVTMIELKAGG